MWILLVGYLYTTVSRKGISFSSIACVNFIVGGNCSVFLEISLVLVFLLSIS